MAGRGRALAVLLPALLASGCIPGQRPAAAPGAASPAAAKPVPAAMAPVLAPDPQVLLAFDAEPLFSPRGVAAAAVSVAASRYSVQAGDTLRGIGNRTGAGSEAIARANGLVAPYVLRPGQVLAVPAGDYHLVREGETGIAIARAYGVPWSAIIAANALSEPFVLRTGQRLAIPGLASAAGAHAAGAHAALPAATAGGVRTLEQRAAAFDIGIEDVLTGGQPAGAAIAAPPAAPAAAAAGARGRFGWPVAGRLARRFGPAEGRVNDGIDIAVPRGTPFAATADGTVVYAGSGVRAQGQLVLVDHGGGWVSAYGNAESVQVARGDRVRAGDPLGTTGDSGFAPEPQLHFELRRDRRPVDPLAHLPPR